MSQVEVIDPIGEGFRTYLLKLEGGDIAASARTSRAPTGGRLVSDVWTDPKHRGKGYSKNVLNAIFNVEPRPLKLRVGAYGDGKKMSNEQLKKYYERLGFTKPEGDLLVKAAMRIKIVLEPSEEGGFTVYAPSLPGCISEGDTKEEALANIREAIELYLEPAEDDLYATPGAEVIEIAI